MSVLSQWTSVPGFLSGKPLWLPYCQVMLSKVPSLTLLGRIPLHTVILEVHAPQDWVLGPIRAFLKHINDTSSSPENPLYHFSDYSTLCRIVRHHSIKHHSIRQDVAASLSADLEKMSNWCMYFGGASICNWCILQLVHRHLQHVFWFKKEIFSLCHSVRTCRQIPQLCLWLASERGTVSRVPMGFTNSYKLSWTNHISQMALKPAPTMEFSEGPNSSSALLSLQWWA